MTVLADSAPAQVDVADDWCGQCERGDVDLDFALIRLTPVGTTDRFCSARCLTHWLVDHLDELEP